MVWGLLKFNFTPPTICFTPLPLLGSIWFFFGGWDKWKQTRCIKVELFLLLVFLVGCALNVAPCCADTEHVGNFTLVSLLHLCVDVWARECKTVWVPVCFHGYLSHPLRPGQGGMLSEPKCPSVCLANYSLGIKPKPQASTPWNNPLCHSSEICHYNLLNFRTDKKAKPLMQPIYSEQWNLYRGEVFDH